MAKPSGNPNFDKLSPLVPKGENREEIIEDIAKKWAIPINSNSPMFILEDVALVDENTNQPINLAELLDAANKQIADAITAQTKHTSLSDSIQFFTIQLHRCRVDEFNLKPNWSTHAHISCTECLFAAKAKCNKSVFINGASFTNTVFTDDAMFAEAQFAGDTSFIETTFEKIASFKGASFTGETRFGLAVFAKSVFFDEAQFVGDTFFEQAEFSGHALFKETNFGGEAWFASAEFFESAWFNAAEFSEYASFENTEFNLQAWFNSTVFAQFARFDTAKFFNRALFDKVKFHESVRFNGAEFIGHATFTRAEFGGYANFDGIALKHQIDFMDAWFSDNMIRADCSLHTARFSSNSRDSARFGRREPRHWTHRFWYRLATVGAARLHWGLVRGFGEFSILTRASTSALVLVPVLAAIWPSIRAGVEWYAQQRGYDASLSPNLPWSWGLIFFAALFVLIGRAIYQSKCPQEVRERSRVDVITDETDEFRTTREAEGNRRLSEAINAIEEAGTHSLLRWFRHPNFVTNRDGRTVWIPSRLEDYVYCRENVPQSWLDEFNQKIEAHPGKEFIVPELADAVMSREAREDITIRAGADARYDIIARQNRQWARAALWCYTLAVILVVTVIWKQGVDILHEMGCTRLTLENASQVTAWICWGIITILVTNLLLNTFVERPFDKLRRRISRKAE